MTLLLENAAPAVAAVTPEELLELDGEGRYELIDGRLLEIGMGARSSEIGVNISTLLKAFARQHLAGRVFSGDCGYQIFADDPNRVRKPDVSFIARGRLPGDAAPDGHCKTVPDLAVEVVSLSDEAEDIEARRLDFLRAGCRMFWVVHPTHRTVHVYRRGETASMALEAEDELTGGDVLPGFACKVAEFFE